MQNTLKIFICFFLIWPLLSCKEDEWESPTEIRYGQQHPELYEKLKQAKVILDGWSGRQSDTKAARKLLDNILAQQKDYAPAFREYARYFYMSGYIGGKKFEPGSLRKAHKAIKKALELAPDFEDAYVLLGYHFKLEGFYKQAEVALEKAESLGSRSPWLHLNRVDLFARKGNWSAVRSIYEKVIDSKTKNRKAYSAALSGMATYYRDRGDYAEAEHWYGQQLDYNPSAWNYGEYVRYLLYWRGDADRAIANAKQALSIMDYGVGRTNLATAYYLKWSEVASVEGVEKARVYFDLAYNLYPNVERVYRIFARNENLRKAGIELRKYWLKEPPAPPSKS